MPLLGMVNVMMETKASCAESKFSTLMGTEKLETRPAVSCEAGVPEMVLLQGRDSQRSCAC